MTIKLKYAGLTDRGRVREHNEDNWAADPAQGLFIVSDGMGGAAAGEVASKIVVETLPALLQQKMPAKPTNRLLRSVLAELSDRVLNETRYKPRLSGMGATIVMLWFQAQQIFIAHMGDSRIYRHRAGALQQLTTDHSLMQLLLSSGEINAEEAKTHPARGKITRYVGMTGGAIPEAQTLEIRENDQFLLCSDGLTGMLSDEEILAVLNQKLSTAETCKRLITAANEAGGEDNITVVIVSVSASQKK